MIDEAWQRASELEKATSAALRGREREVGVVFFLYNLKRGLIYTDAVDTIIY
jgi:hypothetical protein